MVTQTESTAYRLDVRTLHSLMPRCTGLERQLQLFSMIFSAQSTQIAACNQLHGVGERLARWLLMSHDRIGGDALPLTQEVLGQMLGTRRANISVAASMLQEAGIIEYARGSISVLDPSKLRDVACDCYGIIRQQSKNWQAEAASKGV